MKESPQDLCCIYVKLELLCMIT